MNPLEKHNQQKVIREKHKQMEIPVELIKIQDRYNKGNIEQQHKFNLEIFEKQAALTREIQDKQTKQLNNLSWRTVIATILAVIIGAALGIYLERGGLKQPQPPPPTQATTTTQKQNTSAFPSPGEKGTTKATKSSVQEESSSNNSLKKP
jgi:hypothetical protein